LLPQAVYPGLVAGPNQWLRINYAAVILDLSTGPHASIFFRFAMRNSSFNKCLKHNADVSPAVLYRQDTTGHLAARKIMPRMILFPATSSLHADCGLGELNEEPRRATRLGVRFNQIKCESNAMLTKGDTYVALAAEKNKLMGGWWPLLSTAIW